MWRVPFFFIGVVLMGCGQGSNSPGNTSLNPQEERFYSLAKAAKKDFDAGKVDDAKKKAEELLKLLPKFKGNWNYGNAVHDGNLIFGRIALKEGDVEEAKRRLIAAGNSPGSPQMNSFGPNMSLAKDLLDQGEREVVLQYFDLCRKFWVLGHARLDQWEQDVQSGRTPNFGANLLY